MSDSTEKPVPAQHPTLMQSLVAFYSFVMGNKAAILALAAFSGVVYHTFITSAAVNLNTTEIKKLKDDIYQPQQPPPVPPAGVKADEQKPPVPSSGKVAVFVSFVTGPTVSPEANALLSDGAMGKWLQDLKLNSFHVLTTDKSDVAQLVKASGNAEAVVLQDGQGNVIAQQKLTTSDAAKTFIGGYLK